MPFLPATPGCAFAADLAAQRHGMKRVTNAAVVRIG